MIKKIALLAVTMFCAGNAMAFDEIYAEGQGFIEVREWHASVDVTESRLPADGQVPCRILRDDNNAYRVAYLVNGKAWKEVKDLDFLGTEDDKIPMKASEVEDFSLCSAAGAPRDIMKSMYSTFYIKGEDYRDMYNFNLEYTCQKLPKKVRRGMLSTVRAVCDIKRN